MRPPERLMLIVAALSCVAARHRHAQAEADHAAIARAALTEVIRPGYAALAGAAGALQGKMRRALPATVGAGPRQAKQAFAATVAAWSKVEILRFGPVTEDHRYERLFYWPDPKGIGLRQVQEALAKQDESVTLPDELAGKSVALQGLPALEYLLYGDGAEASPRNARSSAARVSARGRHRARLPLCLRARRRHQYRPHRQAPWSRIGARARPTRRRFSAPLPKTRSTTRRKRSRSTCSSPSPPASSWCAIRSSASRSAPAPPRPSPSSRRSGGADSPSPTPPAISKACARCSPKAASPKSWPANRRAWRIRSCSTSITPSRCCAASTSRWPRWRQDEDLRAKIEALRVALKSAAQTAGDMISRGAGLAFGFNAMDGD